MSLNEPDGRQSDTAERVRYSRAFRKHGFKGNSRGHSIQGPFATLEQTFKALPQHVGFNIELSEDPSLPERSISNSVQSTHPCKSRKKRKWISPSLK